MDLMHYDRDGKASTGRMYLPGYDPGDNGDVAVRHEGGVWTAADLPGGKAAVTASNPHDLMVKVAKLYNLPVTNTRIDDERDQAPARYQRSRNVITASAATPAATRGTAPVGMPSAPFNPRVADGGGDRPKIEGESEGAYAIRTAPNNDAAERLLNGYTLPGLRSFAEREGLPKSGTKKDLVERLMRVLRRRAADADAIARVVAGSAPAPARAAATPTVTPRTNVPAGPAPRPTMTGTELLAQRRAARPKA